MKKVEPILNGALGFGKTRFLAACQQILFGLLSLILPKIFTTKEGEGGVNASNPHVEALFKRPISTNLTLTFLKKRVRK